MKISSDPFQYLFLETSIKNTIESVMWSYSAPPRTISSWSKSFIDDKGEGQVFLLHGSPGVGKTCTAGKCVTVRIGHRLKTFSECVADLTQRPLLPLTCGDLGSQASQVQDKLDEFFELGERWGAVVLLDEADVYLEQRSHENLERNSLVSGKNHPFAVQKIGHELNRECQYFFEPWSIFKVSFSLPVIG